MNNWAKEEEGLEKLAEEINTNLTKLLDFKEKLDTIAYIETMKRIFENE